MSQCAGPLLEAMSERTNDESCLREMELASCEQETLQLKRERICLLLSII